MCMTQLQNYIMHCYKSLIMDSMINKMLEDKEWAINFILIIWNVESITKKNFVKKLSHEEELDDLPSISQHPGDKEEVKERKSYQNLNPRETTN